MNTVSGFISGFINGFITKIPEHIQTFAQTISNTIAGQGIPPSMACVVGWGVTSLVMAFVVVVVVPILLNFPSRGFSIPGPLDIPLWNLWVVYWQYDRFYEWLTEMTELHGGERGLWTFKLPFQPRFVAISDPDDVRHVLKTEFYKYEKGPVFAAMADEFLGAGIFNTDGDEWYPQRKIASHLFHVNNFRDTMIPVFHHHGDKVAAILEDAAASGSEVDLHNLFYRFTLDSAGVIAFSREIGSLDDPDAPFARAFDYIQWAILLRGFTPLWWLWKLLRISPIENRVRTELQVLNSYIYEAILESDKKATHQRGTSLIDLFRTSTLRSDDETAAAAAAAAENETLFMRDLVVNFLLAGRDTTAAALSWMFYELARNPEVKAQVVEEIESALGGRDFQYGDLNALPLLYACAKETLRLYPSVPRDLKMAVASDVLPNQGPGISRGSWMVYMPYVMGRRESLWGPDAKTWRPARWLEPDFEAPSPYKFIAFNAGKRTCLGERMAYLEILCLSVQLLQRFDFALAPTADVRPQFQITLSMANGLPMTVTKRP